MKNIMSRLGALGLTVALALGGVLPASASSFMPSRAANVSSSQVVDVQYREHNRPHFRQGRHSVRRDDRRDYYRGHRGYNRQRPGYRQHNGYWFPPAAFIAGAIIGGATRNSGVSNSHIRSCQSRYRSYRASDNTFQPNNGPRQQCR